MTERKTDHRQEKESEITEIERKREDEMGRITEKESKERRRRKREGTQGKKERERRKRERASQSGVYLQIISKKLLRTQGECTWSVLLKGLHWHDA